jgi:tetratricopeptide (TPR) repeat protein
MAMGLFDWLKGKGSQQSGLDVIAPAPLNKSSSDVVNVIVPAPLDKSSSENDDDFEGFYRQGLAELEVGNYEQALMFFDRAIAINENQAEVWTKRAITLQNLNRIGEAIEANQRVITLIKGNQLLATNNFLSNSTQSKVEFSPSIPKPFINLDVANIWFEQGNSLFLEGRYQEAIASYDKAVKIKPDNHEAWNLKGIILCDFLKLYEEAIVAFDNALKFKSDYHEASYNRGVALFNLGRMEEAISSYDEAVKIKPDNHEAWYNRGIALGNLGKLEEAIVAFDNALKFKSDYHEASYNRGVALFNLGRMEEAISSYDEAVKIKPDNHDTWNNRGNTLKNLGRLEEAIASYDEAVKIKPDKHEAWNNRGNALFYLRRYEEAIASYGEAVKIKPDNSEAWYNRGNALGNLGKLEEAFNSFNQAVKIKPDNHEAWLGLGNALGNLGKLEEAFNSFDQAVKIKPDNHEAWLGLGVALGNLGRYEEAIISYDKAVKIKPDNHEAWYNQGNALFNLGRLEEAISSYDKAVKIKPDNHEAWHNRGNALFDLGRYEEAIASYDKAVKIKPDNHEAWYNRGNALFNLGRYEEVIASYDEAVKIKPDKREAWNNRGNALFDLGGYEEAISSYDKALGLTQGKHWQAWVGRAEAVHKAKPDIGRKILFPCRLPSTLYHSDLDQWGCDAALACYREGLKWVQRESDPEGWGQLWRKMGYWYYHHGRSRENAWSLWQEAVRCYHQALETLTEDQFPTAHLETLQDLIRVLTALKDTETAQTLLHEGTDLLKRLLGQKTGAAKDKLERQFRTAFNELTVALAVQTGDWPTALEIAEQDKNALLRQGLLSNQPAQSPDYGQMQTFLQQQPHTAILYWHLSANALTTFLLTVDQVEAITSDFSQLIALETWIKTWKEDYPTDKKETSENSTKFPQNSSKSGLIPPNPPSKGYCVHTSRV